MWMSILLACGPDPDVPDLPSGAADTLLTPSPSLPSLPLAQPQISAGSPLIGGPSVCVLSIDGYVQCSGTQHSSMPPEGTYVSITGSGLHHCALDPAGQIHCWGNPLEDRLKAPSGVFVQIMAFGNHTCALSAAGEVRCWGHYAPTLPTPAARLLRDRAILDEHGLVHFGTPSEIDPPGAFTELARARGFRCGLRSNGDLSCWGHGWTARTLRGPWTHPVMMSATFNTSICAINAKRTVVCTDKLGDSRTIVGEVMQLVPAGPNACALLADNTPYCFNAEGERLGDPTHGHQISSRPGHESRVPPPTPATEPLRIGKISVRLPTPFHKTDGARQGAKTQVWTHDTGGTLVAHAASVDIPAALMNGRSIAQVGQDALDGAIAGSSRSDVWTWTEISPREVDGWWVAERHGESQLAHETLRIVVLVSEVGRGARAISIVAVVPSEPMFMPWSGRVFDSIRIGSTPLFR